jgi:hypothetical protein
MGDRISAAFGIFSDRLSTEGAIETLRAAGFRNTDISSLFPDDLGTTKGRRRGTKQARGAAVGAVVGAFLGGAFGWFVVPENLVLLSGAAIATSLASLGTGSAVGTLVGALAGRRFPVYQEHYEGRVRRGDILLGVHCDNPQWAKKAALILKRAGAEDIVATNDMPNFMHSSRPAVRPVREKTTVAPLRLVVNNSETPAHETSRPEVRKKSAAS